MRNLDPDKLPSHVAIIMDGNGRWARHRNLPRVEGHVRGIDSVRHVVTTTRELGIPFLTLYAFSRENWTRPAEEVSRLLELLGIFLEQEMPLMMDKDIRFTVVGDITDFPPDLQGQLRGVMEQTEKNGSLSLNIALSYSGRREIVNAVRGLLRDFKEGRLREEEIDETMFGKYLYTKNIPDPDFLIRTSGELRISNFLLWQIAYTEIFVTDVLWPDFGREAYLEALWEFARRERRFGSVKGI